MLDFNYKMQFIKRFFITILIIAPLVLAAGIFTYRQDIKDWLVLRNYNPTQGIEELANNTTMTDRGRHLFYVAQPELSSRDVFWQKCSIPEETIILGCFTGGNRIYIFEVTDQRLDGVQEVTAAHEMLHVAYQRFDEQERQRIDQLTRQVFDGLSNDRIDKNINAYRERDSKQVPNELHSILGTEVLDLPPQLEKHYAKYFYNRAAVVEMTTDYLAAFNERKQQIAEYDRSLEGLRSRIDNNLSLIEGLRRDIDLSRQRLDSLREGGQIEEYNRAVPGHNNLVKAYNDLVSQTQNLIDQHNSLLENRNQLVLEERELIEAIDSRPEAIGRE